MPIPRNLLRTLIPLALVAAVLTSALRPVYQKPEPGLIVLTLLSPPRTICVGESEPIQIFAQDTVYGIPRGFTTFIMTSPLGANEILTTYALGGLVTLNYKPVAEGSDMIQINTLNSYSQSIILNFPAIVERCTWHWELTYSGVYPNPKGYWTYYEKASVEDGTLEIHDRGRSYLELEGKGTVDFFVDAIGADPSGACSLDQVPEGSTTVHVDGIMNQPGPGSMILNFTFETAGLPGGSKFQCLVMDQQTTIPFALPSTTINLNALPLSRVVVPTGSSSHSRPVSTAILWQIPGSGSVRLRLIRLSH
jgi:hypothetical protein